MLIDHESVSGSSLILVNQIAHILAKVFSPCKLGEIIDAYMLSGTAHNELSARQLSKYYLHISLLVCIAGFHDFNSSFKFTIDEVQRFGLFGLPENDESPYQTVIQQVEYFLKNVLYVRGSEFINGNVYDFYSTLCNVPHHAYEVPCHLNNYIPIWKVQSESSTRQRAAV